ncbi:WD40/YVTN repeat domain containing superfamily protein [Babesia gibsoni]|uniref:WD40/YVTN repeat domain containing superfamily protein n=1 Tax=Babesia gibsoni TaxID=33632 RepID=A0AAD8P861_BABGI|nr:WD40/YVTN repeat domain containing superfamily protein [Babesia gibsoni]
MGTVKLLPYPVYSLATDGRYIVTSGGGGGTEYGIKNLVEFYKILEKDGRTEVTLKASTSEGFNVLDCAEYVAEHNVWMGSMVEGTVFFTYHSGRGIRIFGRVLTAKCTEDPSQTVARLAGSGDMFITGSSDATVRVWKLTDRMITTFKESFESDEPPLLQLGFTDDYAPTDASSPCDCHDVGEKVSRGTGESTETAIQGADGETDIEDAEGIGSESSTDGEVPEGGAYPVFERRVANMVIEHRYHKKGIADCHISPDNALAASVCSDFLILYDIEEEKVVCKMETQMRFKFCRFINSACQERTYRLITIEWEPKSLEAMATMWNYTLGEDKLSLHRKTCVGSKPCSALSLRMDGSYIGLGFGTGEVAVYKADTLKCVNREQRHMLPVTDVAFLRDRLVSSGADFYVIIKGFKAEILVYILTILVPILAYLVYVITHRGH